MENKFKIMKKTITIIVLLMAASGAMAQEAQEGWTKKGVASANMSQAGYSNWSAGGENSIAFDTALNYDLNYLKGKNLWTNRLELAYGLNNTKSFDTVHKTNDKIYFSSNYGYRIAENLYAGGRLTFATQFAKGYDYGNSSTDYISTFMAPGYLTIGAGLIWTPKKWLTVTFNPATWRGTFVYDDRLSAAGAYGVDPGKHLLNQFGANLIAEVNTPIWENVILYSRLELFSNYLKKPQNIIVQWDTQVNMKINKWLSAGLTFNMVYDDNIRTVQENGRMVPKLQLKEILGVGLQVQF